MAMVYVILIVLLSSYGAVGSYSKDQNVSLVLEVNSDSLVLGLDDKLQFNCWINSSSPDIILWHIYLLIDNSTSSTKMDRVEVVDGPSSEIYTFNITQPSDNGTRFTCILGETPSSVPNTISDTIVLQVEYAPVFDVGNNQTLYHYIEPGMDSHMSCAIKASNPPVNSFTITNDSHSVTNVHANYSSRIITINNAIPDNSATYTCTASNDKGTTYLSYRTFIGGAPDDIDISVYTLYSNDSLTISIGINDNSDYSPAQSLTVGLSGVHERVIDLVALGYSIPVHDQEMIALTIPLDTVYTANYNLFITADNPLGSTDIYRKPLYIEGKRLARVSFEGPDSVTSGDDYSFECSLDIDHLSYPSFNLSVLINGNTTGEYFNRLILGESVANGYQKYTFVNTTHIDNGVTFTCVANTVYSSEQSSMNVFFLPIFDYNGETVLRYLNSGQNSYIECTVTDSNPRVSSIHVSNTSEDTSNIKVYTHLDDSMPNAMINFTNASVTNRGIYSCEATNIIGSAVVHYKTFVGGAPDNLTVNIMSKTMDESIFVGLGLSDRSDAPASSLDIQLKGVGSIFRMNLSPDDIPLHHVFESVFVLQQDQLLVGNYSLSISGSNALGVNQELYYTNSLYLEGTASLDVYLDGGPSIVEEKPYTFSCSVDENDINGTISVMFDVLIDGKPNTTKHLRLKRTVIDDYMTNYTFIKSNYEDDGTVFACRVNKYYTSNTNTLTVYYAPVISVPTVLGGFINQSFVINITIKSNPNKYTVEWLKDNHPLPSYIVVGKNSLQFKSFTDSDNGTYTVIAKNKILNGTRQSFIVHSYDGPYFDNGATNSSILTENKIGSNFELTCSIKQSRPHVLNLTFVPESGPNWKIKHKGVESVTLEFTKGNIANNTRKFTCRATNNLTVATLAYDNHIGDVPKDTIVKVDKHDNGSAIILSLDVTDNNAAPITEILYYIKGINDRNSTLSFNPYSNSSVIFDKVCELTYQQLGGSGATNYLFVHAKNLLGSALVLKYNFTTPGSAPRSSKKGLKIGLGVGLPLAVIVIIVVVGIIYYRRRSKRSRYSMLINEDVDYVTGHGSINQPNNYDSI